MPQPHDIALAGIDAISDLSGRLLRWASPERAYVREVLNLLVLKSGDRLLDVGCGSGELLAAAAAREPGAVLCGIDPDEDALELASHKIFGTLRPVELHQGFGEDLPFDDECFDIVTATRLLRWVDAKSRAAILAECSRVMRPGGRLLVADWAEETDGIEALVTWPWRFLSTTLLGGDETPAVALSIERAGFHPPEPRSRFQTIVGSMDLLEAFKPLHS